MKIIFFGTSKFSITILKFLINDNYKLSAVYIKNDILNDVKKKIGPLLLLCIKKQILLKKNTFLENINFENFNQFNADVAITASFGLIIPKRYIKSLRYGFINIHPSALPRWRGAAPVQRTIMTGDKQALVCCIKMNTALDVGDIIFKRIIKLNTSITSSEFCNLTSKIGGVLIIKTLNIICINKINFIKQSKNRVLYAKKIKISERIINFCSNATKINNLIRSFSPKPGAYFVYKNTIIKIIKVVIMKKFCIFRTGIVLDNNFTISCKNNSIRPLIIQREGKKTICTKSFLNGFQINKNFKLC